MYLLVESESGANLISPLLMSMAQLHRTCTPKFHSLDSPLRSSTTSVPDFGRRITLMELKHAHQTELADATIYEPEGSNSDDNCRNNWLPCTLLPDVLDERLLPYLKTDDGRHLYDVARRCWNPAFLPPLLRQPDNRKGGKGKKKASLDEEEEVESDKTAGVKSWNDEEMLADFFNRIMKAIPIAIEELRRGLAAKHLKK